MSSHRRDKFDVDGYLPTGSEERIATHGDKDGQWGYAKTMDTTQSSDDVEMGNGYMTTSVLGGEKGGVGNAGLVVEQKEVDGWETPNTNTDQINKIVKTVHINQYANDTS